MIRKLKEARNARAAVVQGYSKMEPEEASVEVTVEQKEGCLMAIRNSVATPVFFYVFAFMLHAPILSQYVYSRYSKLEGFPYHYSAGHSSCGHQLNHTLKELQEKVQTLSAHFNIGQSFCYTVPSLTVCIFLGAWSDSVGRKPVIILCMISAFLESLIILVTMALELPLYFIFIASFLSGLGGYFTGLLIAIMAYIADTTTKDRRALHLGIIEGVVFLGAMVSNVVSGHFIKAYGFVIPYILVCSCFAAACLYSIFVLPESLKDHSRKATTLFTKACMKYPVRVWHVLSKPRPGKWKICVMMPATLFVNMLSMGMSSVITLYVLNSPFCLPSINVGYFIGTRFALLGIGAALSIKLLGKLMRENYVAFLGIFSYAGFYTVLLFAQSEPLIYVACGAGVISGATGPIFRGILSKTVGPDEQGALFSAVSSLEMLSVFIGAFIFNAVYPVAVRNGHPGSVFFLTDCLLLLPLLFNIIYSIKIRKELKKEKDDINAILGKEITDPCSENIAPVPKSYGSNGSTPPISPVSPEPPTVEF